MSWYSFVWFVTIELQLAKVIFIWCSIELNVAWFGMVLHSMVLIGIAGYCMVLYCVVLQGIARLQQAKVISIRVGRVVSPTPNPPLLVSHWS